MKRNLELKDIVGYLPYDLKIKLTVNFIRNLSRPKYSDNREFGLMNINAIEFVHRNSIISVSHESKEFSEEISIKDAIPILRPMDDLENTIQIPSYNNGREFSPLLYIAERMVPERQWFRTSDNQVSCDIESLTFKGAGKGYFKYRKNSFCIISKYGIINKYQPKINILELLYQWHFDVNNLIKQGFAIDINTLK